MRKMWMFLLALAVLLWLSEVAGAAMAEAMTIR